MPNELEVFEALNVDNRIPKADALEAYYKIHGALCREYHEEIDYVLRQLEDIRKERLEFTENPPDPQKSGRTDGQQRSNR